MLDDLRKRRIDLLWSLYQRGDGSLQTAALAIQRESGGPAFEFDKKELIKDGAIEQADVRPGMVDDELYEVTQKGRKMLWDTGYPADTT